MSTIRELNTRWTNQISATITRQGSNWKKLADEGRIRWGNGMRRKISNIGPRGKVATRLLDLSSRKPSVEVPTKMIEFTIRTKVRGDVTFRMNRRSGHVYVDVDGFATDKQICFAGKLTGRTIQSTPENFEADCRNWWAQFRRRYLSN